MNQSLHTRVPFALLLLLLLMGPAITVSGQASQSNPFIWQVVVEYDVARSNISQAYMPSTSFKLYSQDFQTVNAHDDLYGHNERLLLDFGDGCAETTISDIQSFNGNTATSPSMMSQPSIALIQRGGRCTLWSDKIDHTQAISEQYDLNVGAALLYDNMTYSSTEFVQLDTENGSYPTWTNESLPSERNIHQMADNDISPSADTVFMAVFFAPNNYGRVLQDMIQNYTSTPTSSMQQYYVQLTMFFAETTFSTGGQADGDGSGSNGGDDGRSDMWTVFTGERGYLAYLIAAGAALILGVVLLRWCRSPRNDESYPPRNALEAAENGIYMQPTGQAGATAGDRRRKMSLTKLNDMCPVQSLVTDEIRTKNSVCAICLEELQEDDLVRVLPCGHGFCVACIDVWLTKKSCLCPICKYDCDPPEESATDGQEVEHEQQQQQHPRGSVDLGNPSATEPHETDRTPETAAATVADSSHSRPPHIAQEAPLIAPPSSSSSSSSSEPSTSSPAANTESSNNTATDRSTAIAQSSTSNIVADTSSEANNSQEKQQ